MKFNLIDLEKYERKEHFIHYLKNVPCSYSMTVNIDITELLKLLKENHYKLYPVILYAITRVANNHIEFRMCLDEKEKLGYYNIVNPTYTIFHKENNTFSSIWTEYNENFTEFLNNYEKDIQEYKNKQGFITKECKENNLINISSIPWVTFTEFNLNLPRGEKYLLPIFTVGKFCEQSNKILLPLSVQVHHAVCDGFHTSRFINELQELVNNFENIV